MTTYAELVTQIQDWSETGESTFTNEIPVFIANAELRIYRSVDLNAARVANTDTLLAANNALVTIPDAVVVIHQVALVLGNVRTPLLQKDKSFLDDYTGDRSVTGTPRYYAWADENTLLLAPTPSVGAAVSDLYLDYTIRPTGLSPANTTTWLGDNAPDVLFYACQLEAVIFQGKEEDTINSYKAGYQQALKGLLMEENARNRTDSYRNGEIRIQS